MSKTVICSKVEGVLTIALNRPDRLNAMNAALLEGVSEAFERAQADPETKAILFTGTGRAFCSGDDLREHRMPGDEAEARVMVERIQRVTRAILFCDKIVIGAINGWAVGGGFEWAINCDLPIWAESAKAFFPELGWGLFVTGGVTTLLPKIVGLNKAREMLILGETYDAHQLFELGVAWRVVPDGDLLGEAQEVARRIAELPVEPLADMKRVLRRVAVGDVEAALALETEATVRAFLNPETAGRIAEFR